MQGRRNVVSKILLPGLLCIVCVAGCSTAEYEIAGKILHKKQALKGDDIRVAFLRVADGKHTPPIDAEVNSQQGTFRVRLPQGKYHVAVMQYDRDTLQDKLRGVYKEGNTKIVQEITGSAEVVIELDN